MRPNFEFDWIEPLSVDEHSLDGTFYFKHDRQYSQEPAYPFHPPFDMNKEIIRFSVDCLYLSPTTFRSPRNINDRYFTSAHEECFIRLFYNFFALIMKSSLSDLHKSLWIRATRLPYSHHNITSSTIDPESEINLAIKLTTTCPYKKSAHQPDVPYQIQQLLILTNEFVTDPSSDPYVFCLKKSKTIPPVPDYASDKL